MHTQVHWPRVWVDGNASAAGNFSAGAELAYESGIGVAAWIIIISGFVPKHVNNKYVFSSLVLSVLVVSCVCAYSSGACARACARARVERVYAFGCVFRCAGEEESKWLTAVAMTVKLFCGDTTWTPQSLLDALLAVTTHLRRDLNQGRGRSEEGSYAGEGGWDGGDADAQPPGTQYVSCDVFPESFPPALSELNGVCGRGAMTMTLCRIRCVLTPFCFVELR